MNRFTYGFIFFLYSVSILGQGDAVLNDLSTARYIIDNQSELNITLLEENFVWNLSGLEGDQIMELAHPSAGKYNIPFLGAVTMNPSGEIFQIDIIDPLIKYGKRTVILDQPISLQAPLKKQITSGYSIVFSPEEMDHNTLNQLPIRPDSIKVSVSAIIVDSDWEDVSLKYITPHLDNKSFTRQMEVDRSIQIKIEPFGWTSVSSVAPMIDWDKSFTAEQRYFIAPELSVPYAILERRNDEQSIAVLDFSESTKAPVNVSGAAQIKAVPNPVINDVQFEIANVPRGEYTIKIKNILGELKIQKMIEFSVANLYPVNIDALRKGSYFYVLEDDQGNVLSTKRLIVLKP